jgi:hypothetical protein
VTISLPEFAHDSDYTEFDAVLEVIRWQKWGLEDSCDSDTAAKKRPLRTRKTGRGRRPQPKQSRARLCSSAGFKNRAQKTRNLSVVLRMRSGQARSLHCRTLCTGFASLTPIRIPGGFRIPIGVLRVIYGRAFSPGICITGKMGELFAETIRHNKYPFKNLLRERRSGMTPFRPAAFFISGNNITRMRLVIKSCTVIT